MNLGKTSIGYIFKKSNKIGKESKVGIKIEYISLFKIKVIQNIFFNLIKRNQKTCNFFLHEK